MSPPTPASSRSRRPARASAAASHGRPWLLFVHQLPTTPSNLRVGTWRRLQQIGALPLKQAVYALPDTASTREDFEWLATEVRASGGEATVFAAAHVDPAADAALVDAFRRARQDAYAALAGDIETATRGRRGGGRAADAPLPGPRQMAAFRERLVAIERLDHFGSAGRDRVMALLDAIDRRRQEGMPVKPSPALVAARAAAYQQCLWVTRPRPAVDRMSSAWLIRRFIDPDARFAFAADREAVPANGVPFDMFGVEFGHQAQPGQGASSCTFETLCNVFRLQEPALRRLAGIVHDLDLKDGHFGAPECPTVAAMIEGLQLANDDDDALLAQGMTLFDSLYRSFSRAARPGRPAPVARDTGGKPPTRGRRR